MKPFKLFLLFCMLPVIASAQDKKWGVAPSFGFINSGYALPLNQQQCLGLIAGCQINQALRMDIIGNYGLGNNTFYNAYIHLGRELFSFELLGIRMIYEIYVGAGYQYIKNAGGMFITPFTLRAIIPFKKNIICGVDGSNTANVINSHNTIIFSNRLSCFIGIRF